MRSLCELELYPYMSDSEILLSSYLYITACLTPVSLTGELQDGRDSTDIVDAPSMGISISIKSPER